MSSIAITGGTGFIGRHLVPHLLETENEIRCLVRSDSDRQFLERYPVKFVQGDMNDPDSLRRAVDGVDTVFHLAGVAQVPWSRQFHELHVQGTARLVEICAGMSNPPCLIYVSSLAAVGPARQGIAVTETTPCRPISPYGRSKRDAELVLCQYSGKVPCSVVRPPYVFGEGDHASIPLFRSIGKNRLHVIPGWFNCDYSFIHAADLSRLLNIVQDRGDRLTPESLPQNPDHFDNENHGKGIYNAAIGEIISFGDFGKMIGEAFGYEKTRVFKVPPAAVVVAAVSMEMYKKMSGKTVPFDWNKITEGLRGPWILSDEKIKSQFQFAAEKSLRERIEQTTRWYLDIFSAEK